MTIGVSIVHFVIKVPKLVQMIVTILYRIQAYEVPIVNPRWPPKIQFTFLTFQHQTVLISRALSISPSCYIHSVKRKPIIENAEPHYSYKNVNR